MESCKSGGQWESINRKGRGGVHRVVNKWGKGLCVTGENGEFRQKE